MRTLNDFIANHRSRPQDQLRLGQRFVNKYVKGQWPELFYEPDEAKAIATIRAWLHGLQYGEELPPLVDQKNGVNEDRPSCRKYDV